MTDRTVIMAGDGDPRHGTASGYRNNGCRCDSCKDAHTASHVAFMAASEAQREKNKAYQKEWRRKRREQKLKSERSTTDGGSNENDS